MYKEKKFKVKIKRNRANNFLICNNLKCHAFLYFVCTKKKNKQIGKPLLKNENFDKFRKKMKINKNQIRIMFL